MLRAIEGDATFKRILSFSVFRSQGFTSHLKVFHHNDALRLPGRFGRTSRLSPVICFYQNQSAKIVDIIHFLSLFSACFNPPPATRPTPDTAPTRCVYGGRRPTAGMQGSLGSWTSQISSGPGWIDETAVQGPSTQLWVLTADWHQVWETLLLMGPSIKEKRMLSSGKNTILFI